MRKSQYHCHRSPDHHHIHNNFRGRSNVKVNICSSSPPNFFPSATSSPFPCSAMPHPSRRPNVHRLHATVCCVNNERKKVDKNAVSRRQFDEVCAAMRRAHRSKTRRKRTDERDEGIDIEGEIQINGYVDIIPNEIIVDDEEEFKYIDYSGKQACGTHENRMNNFNIYNRQKNDYLKYLQKHVKRPPLERIPKFREAFPQNKHDHNPIDARTHEKVRKTYEHAMKTPLHHPNEHDYTKQFLHAENAKEMNKNYNEHYGNSYADDYAGNNYYYNDNQDYGYETNERQDAFPPRRGPQYATQRSPARRRAPTPYRKRMHDQGGEGDWRAAGYHSDGGGEKGLKIRGKIIANRYTENTGGYDDADIVDTDGDEHDDYERDEEESLEGNGSFYEDEETYTPPRMYQKTAEQQGPPPHWCTLPHSRYNGNNNSYNMPQNFYPASSPYNDHSHHTAHLSSPSYPCCFHHPSTQAPQYGPQLVINCNIPLGELEDLKRIFLPQRNVNAFYPSGGATAQNDAAQIEPYQYVQYLHPSVEAPPSAYQQPEEEGGMYVYAPVRPMYGDAAVIQKSPMQQQPLHPTQPSPSHKRAPSDAFEKEHQMERTARSDTKQAEEEKEKEILHHLAAASPSLTAVPPFDTLLSPFLPEAFAIRMASFVPAGNIVIGKENGERSDYRDRESEGRESSAKIVELEDESAVAEPGGGGGGESSRDKERANKKSEEAAREMTKEAKEGKEETREKKTHERLPKEEDEMQEDVQHIDEIEHSDEPALDHLFTSSSFTIPSVRVQASPSGSLAALEKLDTEAANASTFVNVSASPASIPSVYSSPSAYHPFQSRFSSSGYRDVTDASTIANASSSSAPHAFSSPAASSFYPSYSKFRSYVPSDVSTSFYPSPKDSPLRAVHASSIAASPTSSMYVNVSKQSSPEVSYYKTKEAAEEKGRSKPLVSASIALDPAKSKFSSKMAFARPPSSAPFALPSQSYIPSFKPASSPPPSPFKSCVASFSFGKGKGKEKPLSQSMFSARSRVALSRKDDDYETGEKSETSSMCVEPPTSAMVSARSRGEQESSW